MTSTPPDSGACTGTAPGGFNAMAAKPLIYGAPDWIRTSDPCLRRASAHNKNGGKQPFLGVGSRPSAANNPDSRRVFADLHRECTGAKNATHSDADLIRELRRATAEIQLRTIMLAMGLREGEAGRG